MMQLAGAEGDSPVLQAVQHHLASPGRGVRGKMALQAARCVNLGMEFALPVAACAELLHNASLIHDDLSDGDTSRRGVETVWSKFGRDVALCAGDLLISCAYMALADLPEGAPYRSLIRRVHLLVAQTIHGQAADLLAARNTVPAVTAYEAMAAAKSGPLLCLPLDLIFTISGDAAARDIVQHAVRSCAVAYQIADDLDDLPMDALSPQTAAANIVIVMERAEACDRATSLARAAHMARCKLQQARSSARALPAGTDAIVCGLADFIETKLDGN
jgi:geranylgeranyl diphosphate synthase type II